MLITVAAIGRLKAGHERELFDHFLARATAPGKTIGLTFTEREFPESRAGSSGVRGTQEAAALLTAVPAGAMLVALDESGTSMTSNAFADRLGKWRDDGTAGVVFAIGGADGHGPALIAKAGLRLAFGAMTWPHRLVRVMLAEQLYRAVTILSGHPYHRA
jgi:23S rRNA (pseudouridine1915-N3)-methyltransferase